MSTLPLNRDDVHSNPAAWPAWTDEMRYAAEPGPLVNLFDPSLDDEALDALTEWEHPEVDGVVYKLEDFLAEQASYYRSLGTKAADWVAAEFTAMAAEARSLDALTVDQFDARREERECNLTEDLVHAGYVRGLADGRAEGPGLSAFGHDG